MNKWIALVIALISIQNGISNTSYSSQISQLAVEIAKLVENRGVEKVAIWDFNPVNGEVDMISKHLVEDFSVYFINSSTSLQVFDRQHVDQILEELRLHQSGLIDPQTAKELGAFTGVEAIITGQYALVGKKLKLWVKAIETESAFQIAALNREIKLDRKILSKPKTQIKNNNRYNQLNMIRMSPSKKKGSLKLINKKSVTLYVIIKGIDFEKRVLVGAGSSSEVLDLVPGTYDCEVGIEHSRSAIETFQVKIKPFKQSRKKFKGFRLSALAFMF